MSRPIPTLLLALLFATWLAIPAHAEDAPEPSQPMESETPATADFGARVPSDDCAPVQAPAERAPVEKPACRTAYVPARCEVRSREVTIPARTRCRRVAEYKTVELPCFQQRRVPIYRSVEIPVWKTREVPVMRTRRVPTYTSVEVPVFKTVRVPLTREVCDPCTGETQVVSCGSTCKRVSDGTRTERRLAGYRTETYPCGTRTERYRDGTRTEQRLCGYKTERYPSGTRSVRRLAGYRTETVVVCPERTRTIRERVNIPCRWLTVAPEGEAEAHEPLPGTEAVVDESTYQEIRTRSMR